MTEDNLKRKLDSEAEAEAKKPKIDSEPIAQADSPKKSESAEPKNGSNKETETETPKTEEQPEKAKEESKSASESAEAESRLETTTKKEDEGKAEETTPETSGESTLTKEVPTPKDSTPVFGSKSSFRDAFKKSTNATDIFSSSSSSKEASEKSFGSTTGLSFGSRSKFGNAFKQTLLKPSFLDTPEPKTDKDDDVDDSRPKLSQQYKQVDLEEKKVTTGEENEESVFSAKVKLFELDLANIDAGWKERGVGPLHLNKSLLDPNEVRLVMRSQGLLRVVLNYKITTKTELLKGLEASLSPGKFLRLNSVSEGKVVQYLLKFGNETLRDGLVSKVTELQKGFAEDDKK